MRNWTRLDAILVGLALFAALGIASQRIIQSYQLNVSAQQVHKNIESTAKTVERFFHNTNAWFPQTTPRNETARVYNDPFNTHETVYQGLDLSRLNTQLNHGLILQLIRYDSTLDQLIPKHLFEIPFEDGEPYLRILTDYGENSATELAILKSVESQLPANSFAEIDDHLYIVDLRKLINVQ